MARPRTPTKVLDARGSFKKHPERKRDGEPEVREPIGSVPEYFDEMQKAAWNQITSQAPMGVLTKADTGAVEMTSILMAEMRSDWDNFSVGKIGRLQALLGQFGMTPSERARLNIAKPKDVNPFDQLS